MKETCENCPGSICHIDGKCVDQISKCEGGNYFFLNGDCVTECPDGFYLFSYNRTCLTTCPKNYDKNNEQKKCIMKSYDQTTSSTEFKSQISDNILEFANSSLLINGSDFIAVVVLSSNNMAPKDQIDKGISAVVLGNCEKDLRGYYNISDNESLIILNMESKRNETKKEDKSDNSFNLGKTTQIEVYDFRGNKLNLSICDDIKILKYIGDAWRRIKSKNIRKFIQARYRCI